MQRIAERDLEAVVEEGVDGDIDTGTATDTQVDGDGTTDAPDQATDSDETPAE
jgi:hypothetical protein